MRLCIGTAKGIVMLDLHRAGMPVLALADPPSVWCMAQDADDRGLLYAGSINNLQAGSARGRGSLARSDDGGRTWRDITPGVVRDEEIWSVATPPDSPNEVFIGTSRAHILHSIDRGHTFRECAGFARLPGRERWSLPPQPTISPVRSIAFDPANPKVVYAALEEGGVYRSANRGHSFEPLGRGVYSAIHCVAVDPGDPRCLFAATGNGFYRSDNAGITWKYLKGLTRSYAVALLATDRSLLLAAAAGPPSLWAMNAEGAGALMYQSADHGRSFAPITEADGIAHPLRGMVMRLRTNPENSEQFFGVLTDGSVIRGEHRSGIIRRIADRLPPAYDFAVIP